MSTSSQPAGSNAPVITKTEVTWRGDRLFDAGLAGRTHRIDANAKEAPGPVETLLGALASCSGVDIVEIIAKRKTPVERMVVLVTGERRPESPRRLMRVELEFKIDGASIDRDQAERAIQLSFERYCSVAGSLGADIVVETVLTLNGERGQPARQKVWTPGG
ncbi:MAG: OsmC family protein [Gemmatimonadales bacterium]